MKKKLYLSAIRDFGENKKIYAIITALFFLGLSIGAIAASSGSPSGGLKSYFDGFVSAYPLQGASCSEIFKLSMLHYLRFAVFLWVSGWFVWLLPLGAFQIGLKGFCIGYTIAVLLRFYGWRGFIMAFAAVFPQNLILIPSVCIFAAYQLRFSSDRRLIACGGANFGIKRQIYGHNLVMTGLFLSALILCALIEGYGTPVLLKPICGFF